MVPSGLARLAEVFERFAMHDTGHHAELETAKVQMRRLLRDDSGEVRREVLKQGEEELFARLILAAAALAMTALIWLQGGA